MPWRYRSGWLALACLTACTAPAPTRVPATFDPIQARRQLEPGSNEITGSAVLWLSSGGVVSCAGESVWLYPVTHYAREWARLNYDTVERRKSSPPDFSYRPQAAGPAGLVVDPAFESSRRGGSCDADGHFDFTAVGDGEYFVVASIVWQRDIWDEHTFFHGSQYSDLNGTVMKRVRVQGGQKATVAMKWTVPSARYNFW